MARKSVVSISIFYVVPFFLPNKRRVRVVSTHAEMIYTSHSFMGSTIHNVTEQKSIPNNYHHKLCFKQS